MGILMFKTKRYVYTVQGYEIDYEKNRENDLVQSAALEEQSRYIVVSAQGKGVGDRRCLQKQKLSGRSWSSRLVLSLLVNQVIGSLHLESPIGPYFSSPPWEGVSKATTQFLDLELCPSPPPLRTKIWWAGMLLYFQCVLPCREHPWE